MDTVNAQKSREWEEERIREIRGRNLNLLQPDSPETWIDPREVHSYHVNQLSALTSHNTGALV